MLAESPNQQNNETRETAVSMRDVLYHPPGSEFRLTIESFQLASNSTLVVTGRSGAGKTTLLSLISGQLRPQRGQIEVLGKELTAASGAEVRAFRRHSLGIIFQDFRLIEYLTVRDNIAVSTHLGKTVFESRKAVDERVRELAGRCGIGSLLRRYPHQLSHGERQRTAIARALFPRPELILADEPTGNLDPQTAGQVLDLLLETIQQEERSLIFVTHDHGILNRFDRHIDLATEFGGE